MTGIEFIRWFGNRAVDQWSKDYSDWDPLLSRAVNTRMRRTLDLASLSDMRQKHGAILYRGNRVLSLGVNTYRNAPVTHIPADFISNHAEYNCLKGLSVEGRVGTLYVARISYGGNIALSKPCSKCANYLQKFTQIRKVIHT